MCIYHYWLNDRAFSACVLDVDKSFLENEYIQQFINNYRNQIYYTFYSSRFGQILIVLTLRSYKDTVGMYDLKEILCRPLCNWEIFRLYIILNTNFLGADIIYDVWFEI